MTSSQTQPQHKTNRGASANYSRSARLQTGAMFAIGYVAIEWAVHIINTVIFRGHLDAFGVRPLDFAGLDGIFFAPFLHANFEHLISNTVPGAIFCFLVGLSGRRAFVEVTLIVGLIAGVGTWLFGGPGTLHIGASGMVYGWLAYLIARGVFNRSFVQIILGIILAFIYSSLIWGVLPVYEGVSWQGHLFGALGGIVAGLVITSDDPVRVLKKPEK